MPARTPAVRTDEKGITRMAKKSQSLGSVILWIKGDMKDLFSALDNAQKAVDKWARKMSFNLEKWGRDFQKVGQNMTLMGAAGVAALKPLVTGAMDFEKSMRMVNTILQLAEPEFATLKGQVLDLSAKMGVDAVDAAKALYDAVSTGVPEKNLIDFMGVAAKTAIAGVTDMKTSVNGLTNIIQAWKLQWSDAGRVADVMFKIVDKGKINYQELSSYIYDVSVISSKANISIEQIGAGITTLTKQGVPASQAMVQLRSAIQGIIAPNEYMLPLLKKLGYESGEAMMKQLGLQKAFEAVGEAAVRDGVKTQAGMVMGFGAIDRVIGRTEGLNAILGLTGASAASFSEDLKAMGDSAGATERAFKEMEKAMTWDKLVAQMKVFAIQLGDVLLPVLNPLIDKLKMIVVWVQSWVKLNPNLTKTILELAAAFTAFNVILGPILYGIGSILIALSGFTKMLPTLFKGISTSLTWLATAAETSIGGFIGLVLGATTAVGGLYLATQAFAEMLGSGNWTTNFITRWIDQEFPKVGKAIDWLFDKMVGVINDLSEMFSWWWGDLKKGFSAVGNFIADVFKIALNGVIEAMNAVIYGINTVSGAVGIPEIPDIPAFGGGGVMARAGLAIVGEYGPELAALPAGTRVFTNQESRGLAALGGGGVTIHVSGMVVREEADVGRIARELVREMDRRRVALGAL